MERRTRIYWIKFFIIFINLFLICYGLVLTGGNLMESLSNQYKLYIKIFKYTKFYFFKIHSLIIFKFSLINEVTKIQGFFIGIFLSFFTFIYLYAVLLSDKDYDSLVNSLSSKYPWVLKIETYGWYFFWGFNIFLVIKNSYTYYI